MRTLRLESVLALDLLGLWLAVLRVSSWVFAIETYGAGGDAVEALLALDGHVGAVGSLELDVKGGCVQRLVSHLLCSVCLICRRMLTLGGVVEVLVDKLDKMSAHILIVRNNNNGSTYVVGGLAQVTESRDGKGQGLLDDLLGGAVRLGDIGGERGRHVV